jgi:hypothetical protein
MAKSHARHHRMTMVPSLRSVALQHNNVAARPADKQPAAGAAAWLLKKKPATSAGRIAPD